LRRRQVAPALDITADLVDEVVWRDALAALILKREFGLLRPVLFLTGGIGTKYALGRRPSSITPVGEPSSFSRKCRSGLRNGELMTGLCSNAFGMTAG
jgi:hypothetical protein